MFWPGLDLLGDDRVGDYAVLVIKGPEIEVEHGRERVLALEVEKEPVSVDVRGESACDIALKY